jgi:hypothetical protein
MKPVGWGNQAWGILAKRRPTPTSRMAMSFRALFRLAGVISARHASIGTLHMLARSRPVRLELRGEGTVLASGAINRRLRTSLDAAQSARRLT